MQIPIGKHRVILINNRKLHEVNVCYLNINDVMYIGYNSLVPIYYTIIISIVL